MPRVLSTRAQPADRIEEGVEAAWRQTLGRPALKGASFLADGGDSLLATCFVSLLNRQLGLKLSPSVVFETPTFGDIVARVHQLMAEPSSQSAEEARTRPETPALSFSQERMWFMHALASQSAAYNIPLALRLQGPLDVRRLTTGVAARRRAAHGA